MAASLADLARLPDWPRLLSPEQAAAYCGLSGPAFAEVCPVKPIRLAVATPDGKTRQVRRVLYDRAKLDAWVTTLGADQPSVAGAEKWLSKVD